MLIHLRNVARTSARPILVTLLAAETAFVAAWRFILPSARHANATRFSCFALETTGAPRPKTVIAIELERRCRWIRVFAPALSLANQIHLNDVAVADRMAHFACEAADRGGWHEVRCARQVEKLRVIHAWGARIRGNGGDAPGRAVAIRRGNIKVVRREAWGQEVELELVRRAERSEVGGKQRATCLRQVHVRRRLAGIRLVECARVHTVGGRRVTARANDDLGADVVALPRFGGGRNRVPCAQVQVGLQGDVHRFDPVARNVRHRRLTRDGGAQDGKGKRAHDGQERGHLPQW